MNRLLHFSRRTWIRVAETPSGPETVGLLALVAVILLLPRRPDAATVTVGLVAAAPLVLNAIGIVLVYRASRFINFSQVAVGAFAGVVFDGLVRGRALLRGVHAVCGGCVGAFPGRSALAVNFWVSALLALVLAAGLGWLVFALLVRRFANSPVLVTTIVSVFLAQALTGAEAQVSQRLVPPDLIKSGVAAERLEPPVDVSVTVSGLPVHLPQLLLLVIAVVAVPAVSLLLNRSTIGSAVRAAADNPARASALGINVGATTGKVWAVAATLSGLAGVVAAFSGAASATGGAGRNSGIPVEQLVVVLAVVVLARFTTIWLVGAAAAVLSLLQAAVQLNFASQAPLNAAYVAIVGVMLLMQRERSGRPEREDYSGLESTVELRPIPDLLRRVPVVQRYVRLGLAAGLAALLAFPFSVSAGQVALVTDAMLMAIVGLSLLLLTGWAGQVSLGQFAFAAIGAWAAAVSGLPYPLAVLLGGGAGALAAIVVGLPALKLRGLTLAISTLAFAVSANALFIDSRYLGAHLPQSLKAPTVLGIDLGDERVAYYVAAAVLLAATLVIVGLRRSRLGRVLIALRSNEATGQAFGINPLRARLVAFSLSGFMAAVAGAMLAYHLGRVAPESFAPDRSLVVFLFAVIGGLGGIAGPLLGFAYYAVVSFFFADSPIVQYTANGLGALLLLYAAPGGLAQLAYAVRDAMLRRVAVRLRLPVTSLLGDGYAGAGDARVQLEEPRAATRRPGDLGPMTYKPPGQWAHARFGTSRKERVGVR